MEMTKIFKKPIITEARQKKNIKKNWHLGKKTNSRLKRIALGWPWKATDIYLIYNAWEYTLFCGVISVNKNFRFCKFEVSVDPLKEQK